MPIGSSTVVSVTVDNSTGSGLDISDWKFVQANSATTYNLPSGTVIPDTGYVVIGRNATSDSVRPNVLSEDGRKRSESKLALLTPLQGGFVVGKLEGKSDRQAALDAGYAPSTAENTKTEDHEPA